MTTYSAVHKWLVRHYGPAASLPCWNCGQPAQWWAYDRTDPNEVIGPKTYSTDPEYYLPLCGPCHYALDHGGHDPSACKHGHPWSEGSTYINPDGVRECRTCRIGNDRRRRYREKHRAR